MGCGHCYEVNIPANYTGHQSEADLAQMALARHQKQVLSDPWSFQRKLSSLAAHIAVANLHGHPLTDLCSPQVLSLVKAIVRVKPLPELHQPVVIPAIYLS